MVSSGWEQKPQGKWQMIIMQVSLHRHTDGQKIPQYNVITSMLDQDLPGIAEPYHFLYCRERRLMCLEVSWVSYTKRYQKPSLVLMVHELIRELNPLVDQTCSINSLFNERVNQSIKEISQSTNSIESRNRSTKLMINQWSITINDH